MKKTFLTLFLASVLLNCFAQTSLWKISKNGKELYVGGTIHLLRASDYPLPAEFDTAFEKADKLIFETDMEKLENPEVAQKMMMKAMFTDGKSLKDVLSENVYQELSQCSAKMMLPIENLAKFKPSMVVLTMTMIKLQQLGVSAEGVDKHFYKKSKQNQKELGFLESVDDQINRLTNMGEGQEDEFVKYYLKEFDQMEKEFADMISSWRDGSGKAINKQLKEMMTDFPDIYKSLLKERNENWLPQIENFLQDSKIEFVVVGAAHLLGEDGILTLLKNKGYQIEQFKI